MADVQLHLEKSPEGELIIRQGKAADEILPVKITLNGDIHSISNFLKVRIDAPDSTGVGEEFQEVDISEAIITVNKKDRTITLSLSPSSPYGTVITGKLELSDELQIFNINTAKTYTREELVKLLRFNKLFFSDKDKHAELLSAYMAFQANVITDTKAASDTRGNKDTSFKKQVISNIPTEFILLLPVFKGERRQRFRVEICYDVTDGGARFWFESVELAEMIQEQTESIFDAELASCKGFVIINQ